MLVTGYWAEPLLDRERTTIFSPTLDSVIDEDDPVRLVDEVLAEVDWSDWEAEHNGHRVNRRFILATLLGPSCMECTAASVVVASWKRLATTGLILFGWSKDVTSTTPHLPRFAPSSANH